MTMLVTKHFLFLHNMKTGGIWFRNVVRGFAPKNWKVVDHRGSPYQHTRLSEVPRHHAHLPTITVVRNPWEWWVSWFFFNKRHTQIAKEASSLRWAKRYSDCAATPDGFAKALPRLLEATGSLQWKYVADGDRRVDHVVRYETMRDGLLKAIEKTGANIPPRFRKRILAAPPVNTSHHQPFASYYDDRLRDLVSDVEQQLIEEVGYQWST